MLQIRAKCYVVLCYLHCVLILADCLWTYMHRESPSFFKTEVLEFVFSCLHMEHSQLLLGHVKVNYKSCKKKKREILVAHPVFTCFSSISTYNKLCPRSSSFSFVSLQVYIKTSSQDIAMVIWMLGCQQNQIPGIVCVLEDKQLSFCFVSQSTHGLLRAASGCACLRGGEWTCNWVLYKTECMHCIQVNSEWNTRSCLCLFDSSSC